MARCRHGLFIVVALAVLAGAEPTAGRQSPQDTLRRQTPEEYQAMRRRWLEARRMGVLPLAPRAYGSAVVGVPGAPGVADATTGPIAPMVPLTATRPSAGGPVQILCEGYVLPLGPGPGIVRRPRPGTPVRPGPADAWPDDRQRAGGEPGRAHGTGVAGKAGSNNRGPPGPQRAESPGPCVPFGFDQGRDKGATRGGYGAGGYGGAPVYGYGAGGYGGAPVYGYGAGGYGGAPVYGYGAGGYGYGPYGYSGAPGMPLNPAAPGWDGLAGATQYWWSPWGMVPVFPYALIPSQGEGYAFAWPGVEAGECALVTIEAAGGVRHSIAVGVQTLGIADLADLDLAIDMRLSQGQAVTLPGLDGRVLRLAPGPGIEDIRVTPCTAR